MTQKTTNEATLGAVYGLAFGDSWGYTTEFLQHSQIDANARPPHPAVISDDTQMSLYNVYALQIIHADTGFSEEWQEQLRTDREVQNAARIVFADQHLLFGNDEDNDRAPGMTCMRAIMEYQKARNNGTVRTGLEGITSDNNSKGCGTIMRAPWIGLLSKLNRSSVAILSTLQAQTTHGHPESWVASAVASLLTRDIIEGKPETHHDRAVAAGRTKAELVYNTLEILDELEDMSSSLFDEVFVSAVRSVRQNFVELFEAHWDEFAGSSVDVDATGFFGEGWIADEALFVSVAVASLYQGAPTAGIKRLVWTSGDSDSIAAIGGSFMFSDPRTNPAEAEKMIGYMGQSLESRYRSEISESISILTKMNE